MAKPTKRKAVAPKRQAKAVAPRRRAPQTALQFNPLSLDAQFAGLHAALTNERFVLDRRMDSQDIVLGEIKKQTTATNGRVTKLEGNEKRRTGWIAGALFVVTLVCQFVFHIWK